MKQQRYSRWRILQNLWRDFLITINTISHETLDEDTWEGDLLRIRSWNPDATGAEVAWEAKIGVELSRNVAISFFLPYPLRTHAPHNPWAEAFIVLDKIWIKLIRRRLQTRIQSSKSNSEEFLCHYFSSPPPQMIFTMEVYISKEEIGDSC